MSDEYKKTSVTNLVKMWINMMRAITQHLIDENCTQWCTSLTYNKSIENIENAIADKLKITVIEAKVMLNYKRKTQDAKEKKLFKPKERTMLGKKRKYFDKLNNDMTTIQNKVFNAHHAIVKLSPIVISDSEDNTDEAATNGNKLNSNIKTY